MVYDIIKYMDESLVKKIKESPFYTEFLEYIYSQIYKLNSIKGIDKKSNLEVGEIVKARAVAMEILEDILSPFINITDKKKPTEDDIKKRKEEFGL